MSSLGSPGSGPNASTIFQFFLVLFVSLLKQTNRRNISPDWLGPIRSPKRRYDFNLHFFSLEAFFSVGPAPDCHWRHVGCVWEYQSSREIKASCSTTKLWTPREVSRQGMRIWHNLASVNWIPSHDFLGVCVLEKTVEWNEKCCKKNRVENKKIFSFQYFLDKRIRILNQNEIKNDKLKLIETKQ